MLLIWQLVEEKNCLLKAANYFCIIPLPFGKISKGCFRICECVTFRLLQTNFEIYTRPAFEKAKVLCREKTAWNWPSQRFSLNNKYHTLEIQIQAFYCSGNFVQIYAKAISFGTFPISWRITAAGAHM